MKKKTFLIVLVTGLFLIGLLAVRFLLDGPEDTWICENGAWVRHGNPKAEQPTKTCLKN